MNAKSGLTPKDQEKEQRHVPIAKAGRSKPASAPAADSTPPNRSAEWPANEMLATTIGRMILWGGKLLVEGLRQHRGHMATIGAAGIAGLVFTGMVPLAAEHEYTGYALALKPQRECRAPIPKLATANEIDEHLANPDNYQPTEVHVWKMEMGKEGAFTGTQWLKRKGNSPMRVSGFMALGDWIDGSIRGIKGHGEFHLEARNNQDVYYGQMIALDCSMPQDITLICPYVLVGKSVSTSETDQWLKGKTCQRWDKLTAQPVKTGTTPPTP